VGFACICISVPWEGERIKAVGEEMQDVLFKSWIKHNPKE